MLVSAFLCLCSSSRFRSRDCTAALVGQAPDSRTHRSRNDGLDSSSSLSPSASPHACLTHPHASPADTPTCTFITGSTWFADAGLLLLPLPPSLARLHSPCSFIASLLNSPALIIPPHPLFLRTQPPPHYLQTMAMPSEGLEQSMRLKPGEVATGVSYFNQLSSLPSPLLRLLTPPPLLPPSLLLV